MNRIEIYRKKLNLCSVNNHMVCCCSKSKDTKETAIIIIIIKHFGPSVLNGKTV